ncbi:hypothetical protein Mapa_005362 [Marchantia paleacea]|nr:hypothetical protein Mapa_005362 [Marchantia paleacea]
MSTTATEYSGLLNSSRFSTVKYLTYFNSWHTFVSTLLLSPRNEPSGSYKCVQSQAQEDHLDWDQSTGSILTIKPSILSEQGSTVPSKCPDRYFLWS